MFGWFPGYHGDAFPSAHGGPASQREAFLFLITKARRLLTPSSSGMNPDPERQTQHQEEDTV